MFPNDESLQVDNDKVWMYKEIMMNDDNVMTDNIMSDSHLGENIN